MNIPLGFRKTLAAVALNLLVLGPAFGQAASLGLGRVEQISVTVSDLGRAEHFYSGQLGLRKIFGQENLLIYDLGGQRLLVGLVEESQEITFPLKTGSTIYLRCTGLAVCINELKNRGITFVLGPSFVARQATYDVWMAFFRDPDGNSFALWSEVPRGFNPVTGEKQNVNKGG